MWLIKIITGSTCVNDQIGDLVDIVVEFEMNVDCVLDNIDNTEATLDKVTADWFIAEASIFSICGVWL